MMRRMLFLAVILLAFLISCLVHGTSGVSLVYRESVEGSISVLVYKIEPNAGGYLIGLTVNGQARREEIETDRLMSMRKWRYINPDQGSDYLIQRKDNLLHLSGVFKGRKIDRSCKTPNLGWKQFFPLGLEELITSGKDTLDYTALNPSDLSLCTFTAVKKGLENVVVNGRTYEAVHVRITLSGLLSYFWHADSWHRKSDGRYIRYEYRNGINAPLIVDELIEENRE